MQGPSLLQRHRAVPPAPEARTQLLANLHALPALQVPFVWMGSRRNAVQVPTRHQVLLVALLVPQASTPTRALLAALHALRALIVQKV